MRRRFLILAVAKCIYVPTFIVGEGFFNEMQVKKNKYKGCYIDLGYLALSGKDATSISNMKEIKRLCYGHSVYEKIWEKLGHQALSKVPLKRRYFLSE